MSLSSQCGMSRSAVVANVTPVSFLFHLEFGSVTAALPCARVICSRHIFNRGAFAFLDVWNTPDEQYGTVGVYRDGRNPPDVPPNRLHPPERPGVSDRGGGRKVPTKAGALPAERRRFSAPALTVRPGCRWCGGWSGRKRRWGCCRRRCYRSRCFHPSDWPHLLQCRRRRWRGVGRAA